MTPKPKITNADMLDGIKSEFAILHQIIHNGMNAVATGKEVEAVLKNDPLLVRVIALMSHMIRTENVSPNVAAISISKIYASCGKESKL